MAELLLQNIQPFNGNLAVGSFILIQNTNQIPPHISLVNDGNYFSISVAGVKASNEVMPVIKNIQIKEIPSLILAITPLRFSNDAIGEIFIQYGPLNRTDKSCLFPIIEVLNQSYGLIHESEFIFELIKELENTENLKYISHFNMQSILQNDSYLFPLYSRNDINYCIDNLNQKQRI